MIFEFAVGDRVRTVSVVRKGAMLHVSLDGRTHVVDARRLSESALSLLVQNGHDAEAVRSIDVAFTPQASGNLDVHLLGRAISVELRAAMAGGPERAMRTRRVPHGESKGAIQRILSPMPGRIVRVLVKTGDHVKAQQGLVVVEAMKMENELRAARDGRVREVPVAEGQSVEAGAVLLVVE